MWWKRFAYQCFLSTLLMFGVASSLTGLQLLALPEQPVPEISVVEEAQASQKYPTAITLPTARTIALSPIHLTSDAWTVAPDQGNYLVNSAPLLTGGNSVIYGHNTKDIFGDLSSVQLGDELLVTDQNGDTHSYTIVTMVEVDPSQVEWIQPTTEEVLTLFTCSGWLDSKRLVVRAKPTIE